MTSGGGGGGGDGGVAKAKMAANESLLEVESQATKINNNLSTPTSTSLPLTSCRNVDRWQYVKMVFDFYAWKEESIKLMSSTISGIYATLLICIYLSFSFTELVLYPQLHLFLEYRGFFIFLLSGCNLYFIYILVLLYKARARGRQDDNSWVIENSKSHGSVTVRFGAIVFGLGTFAYFFIEMLAFVEHQPQSPCFHPAIGANVVLALLFVFLQTYIIFMYPRINFLCHSFFNK